jgi:hypothetical protein
MFVVKGAAHEALHRLQDCISKHEANDVSGQSVEEGCLPAMTLFSNFLHTVSNQK